MASPQEQFIQQWFENFAQEEAYPVLASETVNALATIIQRSPQSVLEYVNRNFIPTGTITRSRPNDSSSGYSIAEANRHLPPETLQLVEKYVMACQRHRTPNDGRRRVNNGTYRCTYACGYRTKRAYDWRRHEETHEPQELWLCLLCSQTDDQSPFLVNRKDKFIKHVKDSHKEWDYERVLEMSKVKFNPKFDPVCPICAIITASWDDRCRHVLSHYENETMRKAKTSMNETRTAALMGSPKCPGRINTWS
ncbi:hypothetical protein BDV95DRAFT_628122 [Massariosphaeria phaeospora]|uniref:C2H2-type domain-containing protein n=1 Tax=Massariosphaeria phaeospora TaxID=100035 RepID=A0A7C8I7B9_9PLEO|nr:hypothetical protein BDV95DRAFT_628122 [Massariosphaeria phaeospora]